MFKIKDINREVIDTAHNASGVLGTAFHRAMEVYYGGSDDHIITSEADAIEYGLKVGTEFLTQYNDGFINYNSAFENKQKLLEKFAFVFQAYVKERKYGTDEVIACEQKLEHRVSVEWKGENLHLPVKLKGQIDKLVREGGKLKVVDYKSCKAFSDPDKIDAKKILQAISYYFLVFAEYGEAPYSMVYEEAKHTKNKDGGKQVKEYEVVYEENEQFFDFFLRFYDDMTRALMGEMVYVPNIDAFYDNEVAIVAYIHRLDVDEERAKQMKKARVENITELLKKKMQNAGNMARLMKTIDETFVSAKTLNYSTMKPEEKIKTKLMEYGLVLDFEGVVHGSAIDVYRYVPAIGIKMSRLKSFTEDIEQVLGVSGVRILAPIPNSSFVGFEVPRAERVFNGSAPKAEGLNIPVGIDAHGVLQYINLTDAPHVLIGGTTGGGKSVMMRSMLKSIEGNADFWLADPKGVELHDMKSERYAEEPQDIRDMLEDAAMEMDYRYSTMKEKKERTWSGKPIVIVVDEFGDFMLENPSGFKEKNYDNWTEARLEREFVKKNPNYDTSNFSKQTYIDVLVRQDEDKLTKYGGMSGEDLVVKLAQKARAAGMHMIIATQSPRADVVTGRIKANFPTRIALRTANEIESRIILDQTGAEKLLGKGDAIIMRSDSADLIRLQGFNV